MLCIVEGVAIDASLHAALFRDAEFHATNHILDVDYILRNCTAATNKQKSKSKYRVNGREVLVLLHALTNVGSFSTLHLDGVPIDAPIAKLLAKLIARVAMRKSGVCNAISLKLT